MEKAIEPRPVTLTHHLRDGACAGMPVTEVPPSRKCYIYILFFGAREASESKMIFFGGFNLHYNIDDF